ncbi:MAG: hypothetical protein WCV82_02030 [Candidatus Paceibacterota bacterium]
MKYPNVTLGRIEAVWNKLGGEDGVDKFLRDELRVSEPARRFRMEDGVIYFTLPPTGGTTGPQWIERLENKGIQLSKWAKDVLNSPDFKPTTGVVNNIAVLKGELFTDGNRITSKIRAEADKRKFQKPNAEIACWIRDTFTDKEIEEMGLIWIVAMHEPIKDSGGDLNLLHASRYSVGPWLSTSCDDAGRRWAREDGFAFVVPQVSSQA